MSIEHKARRFLIPKYNELALFLMSSSILVLFLIDPELRFEFREAMAEEKWDPRIWAALLFFVMGMFFSVIHLFTKRPKSEWEKYCMLFFAVFVNGIAGVAAGLHVMEKDGIDPLAIFPLWNLANGLLLILMYRFEFVNEKTSIVDDNASPPQALVGLLIIGASIAIGHLILQLYWAMTFSMCVAYASNFDRLLQQAMTSRRLH